MSRNSSSLRPPETRPIGYLQQSRLPWHVLIFILPLILAYEIALPLLRQRESIPESIDIYSRRLIYSFFEYLGIGAAQLPLLLVPVIFLAWHIARGDSWRLRPGLYLLMLLETLCWTLPLLVLGLTWFAVIEQAGTAAGQTAGLLAAATSSFSGEERALAATLAIGAGLYEELVFRLFLLTFIHLVATEYLKLSPTLSFALAIGISSALFAAYHFSPANPFTWAAFGFYFAAGLYLGMLFVLRGFGIVAMTHAFYDLAYQFFFWNQPA